MHLPAVPPVRQRLICVVGIGVVLALQVLFSAPVREWAFGPEPNYLPIPMERPKHPFKRPGADPILVADQGESPSGG